MSALIMNESTVKKLVENNLVIEFIRFKKESTLNERKRVPPKVPPKPKPAPLLPLKMNKMSKLSPKTKSAIDMPKLDFSIKGTGPAIGSYSGQGDGEAVPLVRIDPPYPRKAALQRIEGWVKLRYDVTPIGTVENAKVLASRPVGVFEKSALQAVYKWRFKPKTLEGKPIPQKNLQITMDFKLENL